MLLIHGAYTAANLLAATFLSIFLWRVRQDLTLIAAFTGLTALTIPVAFVLNGIVFRRSGAAASIRLGLLALGAVYLTVLWLGAASANWIVLLGLLRGVGEGWYWAGNHLVTYDTTSEHDRDWYFGALSAATWLLTALLPPVAGAVIAAGAQWGRGYVGYQLVFGAAAVLLLGAIALAGRIDCGHRTSFSLRRVWALPRRNGAWSWVAGARLVDGASGTLAGLVITVLTYLVLAVWMKPRHRIPCAMLGAGLLVLSTLLLPLYVSAPALILFGVLRAMGGPLHGNALAPLQLQVIDRDPDARTLRYEYIVSQELWLGVGRVASVAAFVVMAVPVDQMVVARVVLVVAGAAPMLVWAAFARSRPPHRRARSRSGAGSL